MERLDSFTLPRLGLIFGEVKIPLCGGRQEDPVNLHRLFFFCLLFHVFQYYFNWLLCF